MIERTSQSTTQVLIISSNTEYASTIKGQLLGTGQDCITSEPQELDNTTRLRETNPRVVLIDHASTTSDGVSGHELIRSILPGCEVILIAPLNATEEAARLSRQREVFDYVVVDFANDAHRVPLLVERAIAHSPPSLLAIGGHAKTQHHQILDELSTLRGILKNKNEGPVVALLHRHHMNEVPSAFDDDSAEEVAARAYQHSLIDLICGRIKRLERLVQMNESQEANNRMTRSQLLIVEDAPVDAEIAKFALEKHGYDVVVAESASAAKQALDTQLPDLVLMDIHLGDANGLKLVDTMRRNEQRRDIPVIVVSSDTRKETVAAARAIDIQGFIRKPYDPSVLAEKVKQVLDGSLSGGIADSEDA